MKHTILCLLMALLSLTSYAKVGDETPIKAEQIVEIKQEVSTTSTGKQRTEYVVIYKNSANKRKLAYMTATDYKKLQQAKKYNLDIEYIIVEMKTKFKLIVK